MTQAHLDQAKIIADRTQNAILAAHDALVLLGLSERDAWTLLAHSATPCGILDRAEQPDWEDRLTRIDAKLEAMP